MIDPISNVLENYYPEILGSGIITGILIAAFMLVLKRMDISIGKYSLPEAGAITGEIAITTTCIFGGQLIYEWVFEFIPFLKNNGTASSIALLIIIFFAIVVMNTISRSLQINITEGISNIRLMGCLYSLGLMVFFHNSISVGFATGYILLLIGRFLFYDTTWKGFIDSLLALTRYLLFACVLLLYSVIITLLTKGNSDGIFVIEAVHIGILFGIEAGQKVGADL